MRAQVDVMRWMFLSSLLLGCAGDVSSPLPWLAARSCEELAAFFEPDSSCLDQFELER